MKTMQIFYLFFFVSILKAQNNNYYDAFYYFHDRYEISNEDSVLKLWKQNTNEEPELSIAESNLLLNISMKFIDIDLHDTVAFRNSLLDSIKNKTCLTHYKLIFDSTIIIKSINILKNASLKYPKRLDIHLGISTLYSIINNFNGLYDNLFNITKLLKSGDNKYLWIKDVELSEDVSLKVANTIDEYCQRYLNKKTDDDLERFLKLSELLNDNFPKHPMAFSNVALYYWRKQDYDKSLKYFLKAHNNYPKKNNVNYCIAENYIVLNDKKNAIKYLQIIIDVNSDQKYVDLAKNRLESLK